MRRSARRTLVATLLLLTPAIVTGQTQVDRQVWADFVPLWRLNARTTNETEFSFRTALTGLAPTQYWVTNTLEWSPRDWLGLDAIGALAESRGPQHGSGYFEMRPSTGVSLTWRGTRVRASEYVRAERRILRPLGEASYEQTRLRHREQVLVALNTASLTAPHTISLIADAEWFFVRDAQSAWQSNQLRVRAGLGYRLNAHTSFEVILNDTRRRDPANMAFEDADQVLRLRWREAFGAR
jgi:hypothetical protein